MVLEFRMRAHLSGKFFEVVGGCGVLRFPFVNLGTSSHCWKRDSRFRAVVRSVSLVQLWGPSLPNRLVLAGPNTGGLESQTALALAGAGRGRNRLVPRGGRTLTQIVQNEPRPPLMLPETMI